MGTAAVVGAGALALNPITQAQVSLPALPAVSAANVELAALSLSDGLIGTLGSVFNLLATNTYDISSNDSPAINWGPYALPFQGATTINDVMGIGGVYPGDAVLGGYSKVGLIPQIIADGLPILSQVGSNIGDYVSTAIADLTSGDILGGLTYAIAGVIARGGAVLGVLPTILTNLAGSVVGGVGVVIDKVVQLVTSVVTSLSTFDVVGAVGALRSGLLGPSGIPGALVNLTIGAGVQTGPTDFPDDIATTFVPSTRTVVQQGVKAIAGALATPVPVRCGNCNGAPLASARSAAKSAASARVAVAAPDVSAPAAARAAQDSDAPAVSDVAPAPATEAAAADVAASAAPVKAEKPVKNRAARAGARSAASR
jgi:hypothetical protein